MTDHELKRRLRAIREPEPPPALRVRLEEGIPGSFRQRNSRWIPERTWAMAKVGLAAAAAAAAVWISIALFVGPGGAPAAFASDLEPVVQGTDSAGAVHMVLRLLGRSGEDFGFVNLGGKPMKMDLYVTAPRGDGERGKYRIEKDDQYEIFDGRQLVRHFHSRNEALRVEPAALTSAEFWPARWIREVQQMSAEQAELVVRETTNGTGRIVFREKGVDTRPIGPSFLGDFDRETEIAWDLATGRLKSLRVWVFVEGKKVLFKELESIEYHESLAPEVFEPQLPAEVRWIGVREGSPADREAGPKEVARRIFQAAAVGDRRTLEVWCPSPNTVDWLLASRPVEILFVGEPFRTGKYPGVFVPYKVRLGGEVRQWQMALRNDNEERRWLFDGGL